MTDSLSANKEVNQFLQPTRPMLIGGNWVESINNGVIDIINPATGKSFARVFAADADDIDRAVAAARTAFESPEWNGMTPTERGQLLWRIADLIEENVDMLAELTTLEGIADFAENIRVGPGMSHDTDMGPLISARQLDRVSHYIDSGRNEGAELVTGGKRIGTQGYFLEPTVFANTSHEMKIHREEIFGPVLSVMRVDDLSDVKNLANDTCYGLAASIWTSDIKRAHRFAADIKAGLLWINAHGIPDPSVPFGGYKQSGWGRELGWEGIEQYTELKSVITAL